MKTIAIVQARLGSTRLPNKVLLKINGVTLIEILLRRLSRAIEVDDIVVATSENERNLPLVECVRKLGFHSYQGSEQDVLARYAETAKYHNADIIVRITGDCPLVDPVMVDDYLRLFKNSKADYLCNNNPPTFPDGLDIEIFTYAALKQSNEQATDNAQREHVTPFMRGSSEFNSTCVKNDRDLSSLRWTVDEAADFEVIANVIEHFYPRDDFCWQEVLRLWEEQPSLFEENLEIERNEGAKLGTGQKLWKRAKRVIPGGNMLLSKRPEMFLPVNWPSYFSKSKGCHVWDMDGNRFTDMSIMGIGTNTLGYGDSQVDAAVEEVIRLGNMSTLNCPEEVYLAERLVELHPWSEMVKIARSGGEANAVAVRIARAASGRDKVAICGYHGWHDWYLSVNLADDNGLDGHLLPGLDPKGVPRSLKDTVFPFSYNDINGLTELVSNHEIGVIKMEVSRNTEPENDFLLKVRELATANGIVLIFDECTSGFRQTFGGLHKLYGVCPDMAIFGKALGNGYAITAIIGTRAVMESAQSTFISSTFWTERIGPAAALKTLDVMEQLSSWDEITSKGRYIRKEWEKLSDRYELGLTYAGIPALASFAFSGPNSLLYKTYLTQEMLKLGWLASNSVYTCTAHTQEIIDDYLDALWPIFQIIEECENGRSIESLLEGPVCHSGFRRLN